jgi:hypothetical protein
MEAVGAQLGLRRTPRAPRLLIRAGQPHVAVGDVQTPLRRPLAVKRVARVTSSGPLARSRLDAPFTDTPGTGSACMSRSRRRDRPLVSGRRFPPPIRASPSCPSRGSCARRDRRSNPKSASDAVTRVLLRARRNAPSLYSQSEGALAGAGVSEPTYGYALQRLDAARAASARSAPMRAKSAVTSWCSCWTATCFGRSANTFLSCDASLAV